MSTLLPLFYVTQDEGYSSVYKSNSTFIKDQFSEMIRLSFSLPEKNSFDLKKNQIQAKKKLEMLDGFVADKNSRLKLLRETITSNRRSANLVDEIEKLEVELNRVSNSTSGVEDSVTAIEQILNAKKQRARAVLNELNAAKIRRHGLSEIRGDIETEINTLSLNEEARRVFMSFQDICSNVGCQLFVKSSDSYAKNLLYLKDQIKDLENNENYDQALEIKLAKELEVLDDFIAELEAEREKIVNKSDSAAQFKIITNIKLELFKLHSELTDVRKVEACEKDYVETLNRREEALNAYESYNTGGKLDLRLAEFRKKLRLSFIAWLDALKTSNISSDISFKNDFEPVLGEESVNQLSGSTGSRTVLAFHAALFELAASDSPFKFLILDAPKQHETENIDLDRYMLRLKSICEEHGVQVVFSATEYEYQGDHQDKEWKPQYVVGEKKMFMRKP